MLKNDLNILLATKMLKSRPSCIFPPKMNAYRKDFDETKHLSFFKKDDELLEKYNDIWEKVKNNLRKELASEPV